MKRLRRLLLLFAAVAACLLVLCACAPLKASVTFKLDETESIVVTVNDDKKHFRHTSKARRAFMSRGGTLTAV